MSNEEGATAPSDSPNVAVPAQATKLLKHVAVHQASTVAAASTKAQRNSVGTAGHGGPSSCAPLTKAMLECELLAVSARCLLRTRRRRQGCEWAILGILLRTLILIILTRRRQRGWAILARLQLTTHLPSGRQWGLSLWASGRGRGNQNRPWLQGFLL